MHVVLSKRCRRNEINIVLVVRCRELGLAICQRYSRNPIFLSINTPRKMNNLIIVQVPLYLKLIVIKSESWNRRGLNANAESPPAEYNFNKSPLSDLLLPVQMALLNRLHINTTQPVNFLAKFYDRSVFAWDQ